MNTLLGRLLANSITTSTSPFLSSSYLYTRSPNRLFTSVAPGTNSSLLSKCQMFSKVSSSCSSSSLRLPSPSTSSLSTSSSSSTSQRKKNISSSSSIFVVAFRPSSQDFALLDHISILPRHYQQQQQQHHQRRWTHTYSFADSTLDPIRLINKSPPLKRAHKLYGFLAFLMIVWVIFSIDKTPVSGKWRCVLIPEWLEAALADIIFSSRSTELLKAEQDAPEKAKVLSEQLHKIVLAHTAHILSCNDLMNQWDWMTFVSADPVPNAYTMPGGRVIVNVGVVDLLMEDGKLNESELAAMLAHEFGHAIARHSMQTVSTMVPINVLLLIVANLFNRLGSSAAPSHTKKNSGGGEEEEEEGSIASALFELLIFLPVSRKHEYEADLIGLKLMAEAGYNPQYAVSLHKKLSALDNEDTDGLTKYTRTHPVGPDRIEALKKNLPEAQAIFEKTESTPPFMVPKPKPKRWFFN